MEYKSLPRTLLRAEMVAKAVTWWTGVDRLLLPLL